MSKKANKNSKKNFNEKAEEILNNLNQEEHAEESEKDNKKSNKKSNKKDNKKSNKKSNRKDKSKKDNNDWIKDETSKFSNKVIKITSPIWMLQFNIMNELHNYQMIHKITKKKNIKIRLQNDNIDFSIKCSQVNNDFDFEVNKVVNRNGVESLEKYELDYFEEYGNVIPFKIIIAPIVDFYYNIHTSLLTDGNTKIRENSIIVDANIRKEGFKIQPRDLAIEELDELNRDFDNRLGCSIEYFRRYTLLNVCDQTPEVVETEKPKTETVKIEAPKTKESKTETSIVKVQNNKPVKAEETKSEKTKTEKTKINKAPVRKQIVEKIKVKPKTAEEKIIHYITYNDEAIDKALFDCTNVAERARAFMGHLINKLVPEVTVGDIITYLTMNSAWVFYVFGCRSVVDIRKNNMVEFMVSQISLIS